MSESASASPEETRAVDLDIDEVVTELHVLRSQSLKSRPQGGRPPRLPSRKALVSIAEGLRAALFPNRLGLPDLTAGTVDYYVGHMLDTTLRDLLVQIRRELCFSSGMDVICDDDCEKALTITRQFARRLPHIRTLLESDLHAAYEGDPAAHSIDEVLVCYPGITAISHYRLAHELYRLGAPLIARMISEIAHSATGIDIHPGAQIGSHFFIDHGTGVVIGETAVIGEYVRLYQAVTLGAKSFPVDESGKLVKGIARHPVVEDNVVIYAGATILGRITIGKGSVIGGNVWLTQSVPPGSSISQNRMRNDVAGENRPL